MSSSFASLMHFFVFWATSGFPDIWRCPPRGFRRVESDVQVENSQMLEPAGKRNEKQQLNKLLFNKYFVFLFQSQVAFYLIILPPHL